MEPPPGRVAFVEFQDGIHSPAGPKNFGIESTDSEFLTVLDSDDHLEHGALTVWLQAAVEHGAGIVAPRLIDDLGRRIRTPRSRWRREHALDPAKDGLAYATAPRGLWRRSVLDSIGERYTPELRTGEDLSLGLRLWFSGTRIEHPGRGAYILTSDGADRVTAQPWSVREQLAPLLLLEVAWLDGLETRARVSIASKLWRINVLGAALAHRDAADFPTTDDLRAFREVGEFLGGLAPLSRLPLSVAEQMLASALKRAESADDVLAGIQGFRTSSVLKKALTANPLLVGAGDGPLRSVIRARLPESGQPVR